MLVNMFALFFVARCRRWQLRRLSYACHSKRQWSDHSCRAFPLKLQCQNQFLQFRAHTGIADRRFSVHSEKNHSIGYNVEMACFISLWCARDPWPCYSVPRQVTPQIWRLLVASLGFGALLDVKLQPRCAALSFSSATCICALEELHAAPQ